MDLPKLPLKPDKEGLVQPRRVDRLLSPKESPVSPPPSSSQLEFPASLKDQNEAGLVIKLKSEKSGWNLTASKSEKQHQNDDCSDTVDSLTSSSSKNQQMDVESSGDTTKTTFLKHIGPSQEKPTPKKGGEKRGRKPLNKTAVDGNKLESSAQKYPRKRDADSDSDDNFEVMPFKRRQFRPELQDDSANMFCPDGPPVQNTQTTFNENYTPKLESENSVDDDNKPVVVKKKRGRPRKVPQELSSNDNESSSSSSSQGQFIKSHRSNRSSRISFESLEKDSNSLSLEGSDNEHENDKDEDYDDKYSKPKMKKKKGIGKKTGYGVGKKKKMKEKRNFTCEICDKVLSNYWAFEAHRATVHGERTFVCNICSKAFKRKDHLANHKRSIHVVRTKYCLLCDLKFNRKIELVAHIKTVHPDDYVSAREFLPAESLSPPKESMSPGDTTEDDFSNDGFATMDELDEDSNSNFSLTKEESFEPTEKKKRGRPKKIHYEEEFVENEREVDLTPHCQTCEKAIEESSLSEHEKMWHKWASCSYCGEEFYGLSRVYDHMYSHVQVLNDKTYYKCTSCMFRSLDLKDLDDHFTEVHLRHHCNACESCLTGRTLAEDHIIEKHKPFCNVSSTLFKCRECNETFGALSEAQFHFLVNHFIKCRCGKQPKTTITWQVWDDKSMEPGTAPSVVQSQPTLNLIQKSDFQRGCEARPSPSFLQRPLYRYACRACGVDMECQEDLLEHQAHHHRKITDFSKESTMVDPDQNSGKENNDEKGGSLSSVPIKGKKKKIKKIPKKKRKISLISSLRKNLLFHLKSRKDYSFRDFYDDDDEDEDDLDDNYDPNSDAHLPFGVPFMANNEQSRRINITVQTHSPTFNDRSNPVGNQQTGQQSPSGSGNSQSGNGGQNSGESNSPNQRSQPPSQSPSSSNSAGGGGAGGQNSGSDNPQEPFPNRSNLNVGSGTPPTETKTETNKESEESNLVDSPSSDLDFEALQNVSPNTLQRFVQGNELDGQESHETYSATEVIENSNPEEENEEKNADSFDVVNWEDNGQFGTYLRCQNATSQGAREGELNTPEVESPEGVAVESGSSAPSQAQIENSGAQTLKIDKPSQEKSSLDAKIKKSVGIDPNSSSDTVVNDLQYISSVFDSFNSPQSLDLINVMQQGASQEPIFNQEASDLLDTILQDAEARLRSDLQPTRSLLNQASIEDSSFTQTPGTDSSFQNQHAILLQQRHNDNFQNHQLDLHHHPTAPMRSQRMTDSGMFVQPHQSQPHRQLQYGHHYHDQRSLQMAPQRIMVQQQHLMSSQEIHASHFHPGLQQRPVLIRPQQQHPVYHQSFQPSRHPYQHQHQLLALQQQQMYDRSNIQSHQDVQYHQQSEVMNPQSSVTSNRSMAFGTYSDYSFSEHPTSFRQSYVQPYHPSQQHRMIQPSQQSFPSDMFQQQMSTAMRHRGNMDANESVIYPTPPKRSRQFDE